VCVCAVGNRIVVFVSDIIIQLCIIETG